MRNILTTVAKILLFIFVIIALSMKSSGQSVYSPAKKQIDSTSEIGCVKMTGEKYQGMQIYSSTRIKTYGKYFVYRVSKAGNVYKEWLRKEDK